MNPRIHRAFGSWTQRPTLSTSGLVVGLMACWFTAANARTDVSGNVSGAWTSEGNPYVVIGNINVPPGQTLTLFEGVAVLFEPGRLLTVSGALTALGTPTDPVTFTTTNDPNDNPAPGDWGGVFVQGGSLVRLDNTYMRYGGSGGWGNLSTSSGQAASVTWNGGFCDLSGGDGIRIVARDIVISNLSVSDNLGDGIELNAGNPPILETLDCDENGGAAIRVTAGAGSFPSTLRGSQNGTNGIVLSGTLGGTAPDQTWRWESNFELPYVIESNLQVGGADTLEILGGVAVKLIGVSAHLQATGASACLRTVAGAQPVYFTSIKDDGIGGDTNGDGMASMPAPGDWQSVFVNSGCTVDLADAYFSYGGAGGQANLTTSTGLVASIVWDGGRTSFSANDGARVSCTNATISNIDAWDNAGDGVEITPTNPPTFLNFFTAYRNGGYAMRVTQNPGSFPGNWAGADNGVNGIYVTGTLGGSAPAQTWHWNSSGLPFVVGNLLVSGPDTLEIAVASVVKFDLPSSFMQINGAGAHLRTLGTSGAPVWFTSRKDDTRGGDTNNDGNASMPAGGDWFALYLNNGCTANLNWTHLAYGGGSNQANVHTSAGVMTSLTWNGGGTHNSANDGARITSATTWLSNLEASYNALDGIELTPTVPASFDAIAANGNGGYGIRVTQNPGFFPSNLSGSGNGVNGIFVTGSLGGSAPNQMWTWGANANFPYVAGNLLCNGPDSLALEPGAVVKFDLPSSFMQINGAGAHLRTLGTAGAPVWFTSRKDDAHGGDTNNDGGASMPAGGDWFALYLNNACTAELNWTHLAYGGGSNQANVHTSAGVMTNLTWNGGGTHHSANDGARITSASAWLSNLEASGNALDGIELTPTVPATFDAIVANGNGGYGIRVTQSPGSFPSNVTGSGNGVNGIYVTGSLGGSAPNQMWTWGANPSFPYVLGNFLCNGPDSLAIDAGAVMKFDLPSSYMQINGAGAHLRTLGTAGAPVWFTSVKDDTQGGDTNNNGGASMPAEGDWFALYFNNSATIALSETWIAYGGGSNQANVLVSAGTTALTWNGGGSIRSANDGIRGSFTTFALDRVRVAENRGRGFSIFPPSGATATHCDIYDNELAVSNYGFYNNTTTMVDATVSWWGDATGPFDPSPGPPSINSGGLGDRVTDYVAYGSWSSAPNTNQSPYAFLLLSPQHGAEIPRTAVTFVWRSTTDPEGMPITYELLVDEDPSFASPLVSATGLTDTTYAAGDFPSEAGPLYWRVLARDAGNAYRISTPNASMFSFPPVSAIDPLGSDGVPLRFAVGAPYPNPFDGRTRLALAQPSASRLRVAVYDAGGRLTTTLVDETFAPGHHAISWDGRRDNGRAAPAGVYFYRVERGGEIVVRRVVHMR